MDQDWLADVRRYDADADETVVGKIVRHCGIALRSRDASLVAFSDKKETDRVRESFLKKKLARTEDDSVLDEAIAAVGEIMKGDRNKNRVTVYYLLTKHFDMFDLFGGAKLGAAAVAGAGAAAAAASAAPAAAAAPAATPAAAPAATQGFAATPTEDDDRGIAGIGCAVAALMLGAILIGALVAIFVKQPEPAPEPEVVAAPVVVAPAIPDGAGVRASERDAQPMLTVYFDVGEAALHEDFASESAAMLAYLEANPDASVQISGFNDPTGSAELNARLSKERAESVQAGLVALGLAEDRTDLVKPEDTTITDANYSDARHVEVTIAQ
ncbi:MAG: DUF2853 family protein [Pseudomonadota bacterium]